MSNAVLEHVNITVSNPGKTAKWLCKVFGWNIRWQGDSIHGGTTFHVGSVDTYLAVYSNGNVGKSDTQNYTKQTGKTYITAGGLNHVGIVVDDIDQIEAKVVKAGFEPHSHADYEPGKRFYFYDHDAIEFEVVCYGD